MMTHWTLADSEIDPLELTPELRDFAREMAGESSVELTDDRARILNSAASEIEFYCSRMWFRGVGGAPRVATSVLETDGGNVPAVGALPQSSVVSITSVEQWSDAAAAYVTAEYVARPRGAIRVRASGTYRIEASVTPSLTYPTTVDEATARLYSYRQSYKPRRGTSELSDGAPPSTTGALMRSGAAESLRHIRTPGI